MRSARRQRGSAWILGAAGLAVAAAALLGLDVAQVFNARRELQRAADAAALAAAQSLDEDCAAAPVTARALARANGFPEAGSVEVECGTWAVDDRAQTPASLSNYFVPGTSGGAAPNAARVRLERDVPYFMLLGGERGRRVHAEATATAQAIDTFAVGSGLLGLSEASPVNRLLGAMLGSSVSLDLVSYQGLANARVRLLDLLEADPLRLGSVDELLRSELRLGDLLLASANALSPDQAASASVLRALALQAPALSVSMAQLLRVDAPTASAAGEAQLSAFDLLMAAAQVANRQHLLDLGTVIDLPGVARVRLQAVVIEPAQIAVGGVGTTARTSQVRLRLEVESLRLNLGVVNLSALRMPVVLEALPAQGTLSRMSCGTSPQTSSVGIDATTGLLRACVSGVSTAQLGTAAAPCASPGLLTQVSVLGVGLVSVRGAASADLTDPEVRSLTFGAGGPDGSAVDGSVQRIDSSLGRTVDQGLGTLTDGLVLTTSPAVLGALINPTLNAVGVLLDDTVTDPVLVPLLQSTVDPLLRLLGVSAGYADVHQMDLRCGPSDLVY
jgi:uncharacterized membrane protein